MEIVKRSDWEKPTFSAEMECDHCKSILKINEKDVEFFDYPYGSTYGVKCPVCSHFPILPRKVKKEFNKYLSLK